MTVLALVQPKAKLDLEGNNTQKCYLSIYTEMIGKWEDLCENAIRNIYHCAFVTIIIIIEGFLIWFCYYQCSGRMTLNQSAEGAMVISSGKK